MKTHWPKKPLYWIEKRILYASIPFTWALPVVKKRLLQRGLFWDRAIVGGPAVALMPDYFRELDFVSVGSSNPGVLQRINPMATRTTAGCPNACGFCGVKQIHPHFQELADWPDLPVLVDDNLFAASQAHFDRVVDRLITWGECDFNQGVDSRLLTDYHAERIAQIPKPTIRLALDTMTQSDIWLKAVDRLKRAGIAKTTIRSYALIGFNGSPEEAWDRCEFIEKHVRKVLPMWFHRLDAMELNSVTLEQQALGWNDYERQRIMTWFYHHCRK